MAFDLGQVFNSIDFSSGLLAIIIFFVIAIIGVIIYGIMQWFSFNISLQIFRRRANPYELPSETVACKIANSKMKIKVLKVRGSFFDNIFGKNQIIKFPGYEYIFNNKIKLFMPSPDEAYPIHLNTDGSISPQISEDAKMFYFLQKEEDDSQWNVNTSFWNSPAGLFTMVFAFGMLIVILTALYLPEMTKQYEMQLATATQLNEMSARQEKLWIFINGSITNTNSTPPI